MLTAFPLLSHGTAMSSRFDPNDRRHDDLIETIQAAARLISHTIKEGFIHMADAQAQALADLTTAVQGIADAIAGEIAALQAATSAAIANAANIQPDDSAAIEASVTKLNDLTAGLKASLPAPAAPAPSPAPASPAATPGA